MLRLFLFLWREVLLVLVLLELELELYKYITEMEMDLQATPHLAWRVVSLSFDRRMQDVGESLQTGSGIEWGYI